MKAAVLHQLGSAPVYEDFQDPVPADGEVIMNITAASPVWKIIFFMCHYHG